MDTIATIATLLTAFAALGATLAAFRTIKTMQKQMEQITRHQLTQLSNEQNWTILENHHRLPPALPSWKGLTETGWGWRILCLNHLNLLRLVFEDNQRGFLQPEDLKSWESKGRFWFRELSTENRDDVYLEGRRVLRELLKPEEGWTIEFLRWLRDKEIIDPELFPPLDG